MKKYFSLLILLFLICSYTLAQCPPPGSHFFGTQAAIDAFAEEYPNCTVLSGYTQIGTLDEPSDISNLNGLAAITTINGGLGIEDNTMLTSLAGLESLQLIQGDLVIAENTSLTSLEGLNALSLVAGSLRISDNPVLLTIGGLDNLASVSGDLTLAFNSELTTLEGLEALVSLGGSLVITDHAALTTIAALQNLLVIDGFLQITYNAALTTLTGLENINATTIDNVFVQDNPQLSDCAVQSLCDYLGLSSHSADICYNALGCASSQEVATACLAVNTDNISDINVKLFPNPTNGQVHLGTIDAQAVEVFTLQGRRITDFTKLARELDISSLPSGTYYLRVRTESATYLARVVRL